MFSSILNLVSHCFKMLKRRPSILVTLAVLGVCGFMATRSGLGHADLKDYFNSVGQHPNGLMEMYSKFTSGEFELRRVNIFQLAEPYLCALVIIQLLLVLTPAARKTIESK